MSSSTFILLSSLFAASLIVGVFNRYFRHCHRKHYFWSVCFSRLFLIRVCSEFSGLPASSDDSDVGWAAAQQKYPPCCLRERSCKDQDDGLRSAEGLRAEQFHLRRLPSFGNRSVQTNTTNM